MLYFQETLLALAKAVANATAQLVLKAKSVASTTEDQGLQNKVISSATSCALATSQLVACTKVRLSSYCIQGYFSLVFLLPFYACKFAASLICKDTVELKGR